MEYTQPPPTLAPSLTNRNLKSHIFQDRQRTVIKKMVRATGFCKNQMWHEELVL